MSLHEYLASKEISRFDPPFYAIIMAAMRQADSSNLVKLRAAWPEVWDELNARYNAPGGRINGDPDLDRIVTAINDAPYPPIVPGGGFLLDGK